VLLPPWAGISAVGGHLRRVDTCVVNHLGFCSQFGMWGAPYDSELVDGKQRVQAQDIDVGSIMIA
jgi:hypothetical protein